MANVLIKFAELHTPLFLAGVNFGTKLDPNKRSGVKITLNCDLRWLLVEYNGQVSIIPEANVASMIPTDASEIGYEVSQATKPGPSAHVFASHPVKSGLHAQVSDPVRDVVHGKGK